MLMAMFMRENGLKIKQIVLGLIHILMELNILDIEKMISNMVMAPKLDRMGLNMQETMNMEKSMGKEYFHDQITAFTKENLETIVFTDMELTNEVTEENLLASENLTKWTEKEFSHETMDEATQESTQQTEKKVEEYLADQMVNF